MPQIKWNRFNTDPEVRKMCRFCKAGMTRFQIGIYCPVCKGESNMQQVIHKEIVEMLGSQSVPIAGLVKVLSFAVQQDRLVMYFVREETSSKVRHVEIVIHGTGHAVVPETLESMVFMGTHLINGGRLVWHVWAQIN